MSSPAEFVEPFGKHFCEAETSGGILSYQNVFFQGTRFNNDALRRDTFLIHGRKGSGKTALCTYFSFPEINEEGMSIVLEQEQLLGSIILPLINSMRAAGEHSQAVIAKVWEHVIWTFVLWLRQGSHGAIERAARVALLGELPRTREQVVARLARLADPLHKGHSEFMRLMRRQFVDRSKIFDDGVHQLLKSLTSKRVFIAIDSAEQYDESDADLMLAVASLVQCGERFNRDLSSRGVHLKVFLNGESYSALAERYVTNYAKQAQNVVWLTWHPRELLRLACYRLHHNLIEHGLLPSDIPPTIAEKQWSQHRFIKENIWDRFFSPTVVSRIGRTESTWTYVIRHTQMRPRQLIMVGNTIARLAFERKQGTPIPNETIRDGVASVESELATEVFNSYQRIYSRAGDIVRCMSSGSAMVGGSEVHKIAPRSAQYWDGKYSREAFVDLLLQLGVLGKVREKNDTEKVIEADFQYFAKWPLPVHEDDQCVIHPMFCGMLSRRIHDGYVVYPFPDRREVENLE